MIFLSLSPSCSFHPYSSSTSCASFCAFFCFSCSWSSPSCFPLRNSSICACHPCARPMLISSSSPSWALLRFGACAMPWKGNARGNARAQGIRWLLVRRTSLRKHQTNCVFDGQIKRASHFHFPWCQLIRSHSCACTMLWNTDCLAAKDSHLPA